MDKKITSLSKADCLIIDGHAEIRALPGPPLNGRATFRDMATKFSQHVLKDAQYMFAMNVHVIFDRYMEDSIKRQSREKRGDFASAGQIQIVLPSAPAPNNWNDFLKIGYNKEQLAKCYTKYMVSNPTPSVTMYVSGGLGDSTIGISQDSVGEVQRLCSNQEQADTKLILHAIAAAEDGASIIVVKSPDTDVLVLLLHHRPLIKAKELYLLTGREGKYASLRRYIPVHHIFDKLTKQQHSILLSIYCISGCDTTSSLRGHGKKTAYRIMMQKAHQLQDLATLGDGKPTSKQRAACVKFVGAMYGEANCQSLNALRCKKSQEIKLRNVSQKKPRPKLPPTDDSMWLHILRCAYQLMIWRQAMIRFLELVDVCLFGYERDGSTKKLQPKMMSQQAAAPELLNDLVCSCPPYGCNENCTCLTNDQPCTAQCDCQAVLPEDDIEIPVCTNPKTLNMLLIDSDSDSDSD